MLKSDLIIPMRVAMWAKGGYHSRYVKTNKQKCLDGERCIEGWVVGYGRYVCVTPTVVKEVPNAPIVCAVMVRRTEYVTANTEWVITTRPLAGMITYDQFLDGHNVVTARKERVALAERELRNKTQVVFDIVKRHWRAFVKPPTGANLIVGTSYDMGAVTLMWPYDRSVEVSMQRGLPLGLGKGAKAALTKALVEREDALVTYRRIKEEMEKKR